jgi:hypothetical protein
MHFGLTTPIVTLVPCRHAAWEESAGVDELRRIAAAAASTCSCAIAACRTTSINSTRSWPRSRRDLLSERTLP